MTRYGMVIDVKKCVGCYNCFLTCRDEFAGNDYPGYAAAQPMSGMNWTKVIEIERGQYPQVKVDHVPVQCIQCDARPASSSTQTGAVYRRPDGIVMIDPAEGQRATRSSSTPARTARSSGTRSSSSRRSASSARICSTRASRSRAAWSRAPRAPGCSATWTTRNSEVAKLVAVGRRRWPCIRSTA